VRTKTELCHLLLLPLLVPPKFVSVPRVRTGDLEIELALSDRKGGERSEGEKPCLFSGSREGNVPLSSVWLFRSIEIVTLP
jgi:hypothetical protein